MKYRRKPAVVEAFELTADVEMISPDWFAKAVRDGNITIDRSINDGAVHVYGCTIYKQRGSIGARCGDYIIREESGEIRPCKAKEFRSEYERVQEDGN